jgi:hypothetical protein
MSSQHLNTQLNPNFVGALNLAASRRLTQQIESHASNDPGRAFCWGGCTASGRFMRERRECCST